MPNPSEHDAETPSELPPVQELLRARYVTDAPPATDAAIRWTEEKLGVRLPPEYKKIVKVQNGGRMFRRIFPLKKQPDGQEWRDDYEIFFQIIDSPVVLAKSD